MNKLPPSTIKLISSSQVISDIKGVVKELVENSLDAGCDSIDIKLEQNGISKIEVSDNGPGICEEHVTLLCKPYFTSKLSKIDDLCSLKTLGFRGEALHSICTVSNVTITARTKNDENSMIYTFTNNGSITDSKPSHHNIGTIVTVGNLFKNLPVRRHYYKNVKYQKDEVKQIEELLVSLSFCYPNLRWTLKNDKNEISRKNRATNLNFCLQERFGSRMLNQLTELNINEDDITINGFVPKKDCDSQIIGRSIGDRIYISVNKRPVFITEIKKLLKEYFNEYSNVGPQRYPLAVIRLTVSPDAVDVNVEPNKTKVFLHNIDEILLKLKETLDLLYKGDGITSVSTNNVTEIHEEILTDRKSLKKYYNETQNHSPVCANTDTPKALNEEVNQEGVNTNYGALSIVDSPKSNQSLPCTNADTPKAPVYLEEKILEPKAPVYLEEKILEPKAPVYLEEKMLEPIELDIWSKGCIKTLQPVSVLTPCVQKTSRDEANNSIQKKRKLSSPILSTPSKRPARDNLKSPRLHAAEHKPKQRLKDRSVSIVPFTVDSLRKSHQYYVNNLSNSAPNSESSFTVVGRMERLWVIFIPRNKELYVIDEVRLREISTYEKMAENYSFHSRLLDSPVELSAELIGEDNFNTLLTDTSKPTERNGSFICNNYIQKNCFLIKESNGELVDEGELVNEGELVDEGESSKEPMLTRTHMTDEIPNDGIVDLNELLDNSRGHISQNYETQQWPKKAINWINNKATKLAQNSTNICSRKQFTELLEEYFDDNFSTFTDIHGRLLMKRLDIPTSYFVT